MSIRIATRGSALALTQSNMVLAQCRAAFPHLEFELKIIKTTGDKMQTMALANPDATVSKGLFTKELEVAMLKQEADFAVHSLKDLPTELPEGLALRAVSKRADVRDVLIYRDARAKLNSGQTGAALAPGARIHDFPSGATIATSSTRRQAQLLALRPDLTLTPIRGNVGTRLRKLTEQQNLSGIVLAAAGLERLGFKFGLEGELLPPASAKNEVPPGLLGVFLSVDEMLPCVGQAALGIEARADDEKVAPVCRHLDDYFTHQCVKAERAFLHGMGGGCLSPVAAFGEVMGDRLRLRAVSFRSETVRRGEMESALGEAEALGQRMAAQLG